MIAIDTSGTYGSNNAGSTSLTYAFDNVAGDLLSVGVRNLAADGTPTVTYNGVSMTQVNRVTFAGGAVALTTFILSSPATGSNNVVVTQTGTSYLYSTPASYSGTSITGQPVSNNTSSGAAITTLACSTTVVASDCWLIGFCTGDNGNNPTAGANTIIRSTIGVDKYLASFDSNGTVGTGSQTLNFGMPVSQAMAASVFSIKPPSMSNNFLLMM